MVLFKIFTNLTLEQREKTKHEQIIIFTDMNCNEKEKPYSKNHIEIYTDVTITMLSNKRAHFALNSNSKVENPTRNGL